MGTGHCRRSSREPAGHAASRPLYRPRPEHQEQGIAGRLVNAALKAARTHGMDCLLVKAQSDATGFFKSRGFSNLPVENAGRDIRAGGGWQHDFLISFEFHNKRHMLQLTAILTTI